MYAGIAGLRTHMQNLNVIGNNVANVNTYGYKSARSVFKTSLYTSLNGGSDGTDTLGGINPSQIGYGSTMTNVDIDMSTGNYNVTGSSTDMMIDGDGFFLVGDKTIANNFDGSARDVNTLKSLTLTRVGDFDFAADGYLANNDGNCVYGFLCIGFNEATGKPIFSDQLVPIRYPRIETTTTGTPPVTSTHVKYPTIPENGGHLTDAQPEDEDATEPLKQATFSAITVDKNTGIITATCNDTNELVTIGMIAVGLVKNPNGVTNLGDNYYQAGEGSGGLSIATLGGAAQSNGITHVNSSLAAGNQTGGAAADDTQIPDGLRILSGGKTRVLTNGLEMSKTDLAQEISQMILTQRGYQANTRIVTVTDSMLEELVNMKR